MGFLETIESARAFLERNGRVSLRVLTLEFDLSDDQAEALVEELVDVQQVAALEGKVLSWIGSATALPAAEAEAAPTTPGATAARSPAEAERRQLTVMFCDLVGSTKLAAGLDPEDWREVVRLYQQACSEAIDRYEGHVAQYLGDGLLVYFGYPRAHEDDAERAVRAGREILTALGTLNETLEPQHGVRLAARVGIHTGPVVVGEIGGGTKSETLALGDTPNVAARLESVAEPDSVVISGATLRLVPGIFVTKDRGTPDLKGIAEPIRAYAVLQATGVRSRLDVDPSRLTPLVGRDQEVGLLLERWQQVEEGAGQTVLVSGEAGLGKSRLLLAFRERLAETPHGWLECRCSPFTQGSAFHPLVELMEQGLGFQAGDDPEMKLARLEAGVAAAGLSAPDVVPLLPPLLSLPLPDRYPPLQFSPELQRKKTIEALVAWVFGLAESQPLVLLVEDLHWCDASTVELLGWLLEQSPTAKVLTLLSFRPDFQPPWPARSHMTALAVKSLSRRQATNLIGGMTGDVSLPGALVERVVERSDGVPLFAEELTKMVLESDRVEEREGGYVFTGPITQLAIPATLQDSLMARLDRLDEGKAVAQLGAALGREFSYELLLRVSLEEEPRLRAGLTQLVDAELLYQRGALPEAEFSFKHALIQETAYQSLLKSVRQQLHGRIAEALEKDLPKRAAEAPEVVAHHYDRAGRVEDALPYYQRAGDEARVRAANVEAIANLERGLDLAQTLPDGVRCNHQAALQVSLASALAASHGSGSEQAFQAWEQARQLCKADGNPEQLVTALKGMAAFYHGRSRLETAIELGEEILAEARRTGDEEHLLMGYAETGLAKHWQGRFRECLEDLDAALAVRKETSHGIPPVIYVQDSAVSSYALSSWSLWHLGYADRAAARAEAMVEYAQTLQHPYSLAVAYFYSAGLHMFLGDWAACDRAAERSLELSGRLGFPLWHGVSKVLHALAVARTRGADAVGEATEGLGSAAGAGNRAGAPALLWMLARIHQEAGREAEALTTVRRGLRTSAQLQQSFLDAELLRLEAELLLPREEALAESLLLRARELAHSQGTRGLELRAATTLSRLWQGRGQEGEAGSLLRPIYAWFTEGLDTQDLKDARALLEELNA